jgi:hypothetical protein
MTAYKKKLSLLLAVSIILCYIPQFMQVVHGASPVTLTAYAYNSGTLTLRWPSLAGTSSVKVLYHQPLLTGPVEIISNQSTNTIDISGLQDNIIYDIYLEVYSGQNCSGSLLSNGLIYFCPRITFYSKILEQNRKVVPGGGFETGVYPGLNLRWAMPKVWVPATIPEDPTNGSFQYVNNSGALATIQNKINSIYNDGREISSFNFRINISTDFSTLNSGSSHSSLLINQAGPEYTVNVSGNATEAKVYSIDSDGYMNFDLIGRMDSSAEMPEPANQYQLPDGEILPGTVYYMNIKPVTKNSAGNLVNAVTVGAYTSQNGSILSGTVPYTYTPIRFQISRDDANNVYVKVFRINQGSLDLPSLKYEVQTSDDPTIEGDWKVRKWMNDSFFPNNSQSAITAFTILNPNNLLYYKVVVKTDSSDDRLESPKLPYTLSEDINKPPVPMDVAVINKTLVAGQGINPQTNETVDINSTDITISWKKPVNWDKLKANTSPYNENEDLYFHFMISTNQSDINTTPYPPLEAEGTIYGHYPVKYRLVKYVSALSNNIKENGNHLEYTIKGFELFKVNGSDIYNGIDGETDVLIPNTEAYPTFLLPNKVYYLQMYTTNGANKGSGDPELISDKSVTVSFTTLTENAKDVPLPIDLRLSKNDTRIEAGPTAAVSNYIELQFDKVNINWLAYTSDLSVTKAVYYDLYASTSTETDKFILIGSTEDISGDISFVGKDIQSTSIKATIENFSENTVAYSVFGPKLKPNSTYYFMAKTRVVVGNNTFQSIFTSILSVTTVVGSISPPDETSRLPLSPTDFAIAEDENGDQLVDGSSVVLNWTQLEPNVRYNIICTTEIVEPDAPQSSYEEDQYYVSFNAIFGNLSLDPEAAVLADNFEYNPATKKCTYTIDTWLYPNRLYYFSIRAEDKSTGKTSSWISIPVTTLLIDPPASLQAVNDAELALFWTDNSLNTKTEDFKLYAKGPDDSNYEALTRSQFIISKDGNVFYGRIFNLKANSSYNIRVYKGNTELSLVTEKIGMKTKDSCHSAEVKWKGQPGYKYELAIKAINDTSYTVISDSDMEQYTDKDGFIKPYYIEKSPELSGTNYLMYYGKINTIPVKQADGSIKRVPLSSNTKYHIKVRSYKVDSMDTSIVSYSKYIGPVDLRTEFNQEDYDKNDQDTKNRANFLNKISKLEENLFWKLATDGSSNKLLVKGSKLTNALENNGRYPLVLDISGTGIKSDSDVLYIPSSIIELLNTTDKGLVIKTSGAEFTLKPRTIDLGSADLTSIISGSSGDSFKDVFFKLTVTRSTAPDTNMPSGTTLSSKVNKLDVKALKTTITNAQLEDKIKDKLYNEKTGLVNEKLSLISDKLKANSKLSSKELENYLISQINDMEMQLSDYINKVIEGSVQAPGIIKASSGITQFNDPLVIKLFYTGNQGFFSPYVNYETANSWKKISNFSSVPGYSITFSAAGTGKYAVLCTKIQAGDIPQNYYAAEAINKFGSRYDLGSIFGSESSFYPESPVSVKETILLYEKTSGAINNAGLDLKQKCTLLGLDTILNAASASRDIERQEFAAVLAKLYVLKMGVHMDSLTPSKNLTIKDEINISNKYLKPVLICLDSRILNMDEKGNFRPTQYITRAEAISALVKLLEITGDL